VAFLGKRFSRSTHSEWLHGTDMMCVACADDYDAETVALDEEYHRINPVSYHAEWMDGMPISDCVYCNPRSRELSARASYANLKSYPSLADWLDEVGPLPW